MIILFSILGLSLLILVHELGHFLAAKAAGARVDEFGIGFPPRLGSRTVGKTTYSLNALPFGGFVRIHGEGALAAGEAEEPGRSFTRKSLGKKVGILVAGVGMNALVGWALLAGVFVAGAPEHLIAAAVSAGSPAAVAGIQPNDVILWAAEAGGTELRDPIAADVFVELGKRVAGRPLEIGIRGSRGARTVSVIGRVSPPEGQGPLGIALSSVGFPALPPIQAGAQAFVESGRILGSVVASMWRIVTRVFVDPTVLQSVAGPVGIVSAAAGAGEQGVVYVVQLLALISLNLVVLNLIPFPALDGGRILLLLVEKLARRPIPIRAQQIVNGAGLVALLVLMAVVTVQDVGKLL